MEFERNPSELSECIAAHAEDRREMTKMDPVVIISVTYYKQL